MADIDSEGTARVCLFCGQPADSREHIFPCWLRKVLPSDYKVWHFRGFSVTDADERDEWERRPFREKTRFVCGVCNNGWMSDLEAAAAPVLTRAIAREGLPYDLDADAQHVAATWALKTCLVIDGSQSVESLAPRYTFDYLYAHRQPPPQATVWIGSHYRATQDPINSVYIPKPLKLSLKETDDAPEEPVGSAYMYFLAVAGVCFLIIGHGYGNRTVMTLGEPWKDSLIKIWPIQAPVISYPPEYMMDRDFVNLLLLSNTVPPPLEVRIAP